MAQIKVQIQDQFGKALPGAIIGGDNNLIAKTDTNGRAFIETAGATRFIAKITGHQSQTFPVSSIPPVIILQKIMVSPVNCKSIIIDNFKNQIPMFNLQPSTIRVNTPPDFIITEPLNIAVSKTVQVLDSDNQPLESVNVSLSNGQGVITDASGIFRLNQVSGNLTATITHVASSMAEQFLVKDLPSIVILNTSNNLDEVTVTGKLQTKNNFSTATLGWILGSVVLGTFLFRPKKKGLNGFETQKVIIQ